MSGPDEIGTIIGAGGLLATLWTLRDRLRPIPKAPASELPEKPVELDDGPGS